MAVTPIVFGPAIIKCSTTDGSTLSTLGYSRGGVVTVLDPYFDEVPSDRNGGENGPPVDFVWLGQSATIRLEMTEFDNTVAAFVNAVLRGGTAGQPSAAGSLMFSDSKYFRLLIHSTTNPINFPVAFPRGQIEYERRSSYATHVMEWAAYKYSSNDLYNATTS